MKVAITGRHIEISDAYRASVEEGLSELMTSHRLSPIGMDVTLTKQNHTFTTDVHVHVNRGLDLRASGTATDGYTSFQNSLEMLKVRLRRHMKRLNDHSKHRDVHFEELPQTILNGAADEFHGDDENLAAAVIAEMKVDIPTQSVGDAVMHFDLSQVPAYVFRNSSSGEINVIYRRMDGNIGWIDPKRSES